MNHHGSKNPVESLSEIRLLAAAGQFPQGPHVETLQRNAGARAQATRSDVPQNPFEVSEDIGTMRRRKVAFEAS